MNIVNLTIEEIKKIVASDVSILAAGTFPDMRLVNNGPDWEDEEFVTSSTSNLNCWIAKGPKITD